MSFYSNLGGIRTWGRKLVLPAEEIKKLLKKELFDQYRVDKVIDFGAGTLYWSRWFQEIAGEKNIYPVDVIFKETEQDALPLFSRIQDIPGRQEINGSILFFTCDVLHPLTEKEWEDIEQIVYRDCDFVVIKDINCHFKFKNWMNRMHDRVINGEKIRDIDPKALITELQKHGYQCYYRDIHKLWYPHFIIIAARKK